MATVIFDIVLLRNCETNAFRVFSQFFMHIFHECLPPIETSSIFFLRFSFSFSLHFLFPLFAFPYFYIFKYFSYFHLPLLFEVPCSCIFANAPKSPQLVLGLSILQLLSYLCSLTVVVVLLPAILIEPTMADEDDADDECEQGDVDEADSFCFFRGGWSSQEVPVDATKFVSLSILMRNGPNVGEYSLCPNTRTMKSQQTRHQRATERNQIIPLLARNDTHTRHDIKPLSLLLRFVSFRFFSHTSLCIFISLFIFSFCLSFLCWFIFGCASPMHSYAHTRRKRKEKNPKISMKFHSQTRHEKSKFRSNSFRWWMARRTDVSNIRCVIFICFPFVSKTHKMQTQNPIRLVHQVEHTMNRTQRAHIHTEFSETHKESSSSRERWKWIGYVWSRYFCVDFS